MTTCMTSSCVTLSSDVLHRLNPYPCPFSGSALSRFLTQSHCPKLIFFYFELNEEHCRTLVATEDLRNDLAITLRCCLLTAEGEPILFDGIRRNRGPTSIDQCCHFNTRPFAEALRGNTRIKCLSISLQERIDAEDNHFLLQTLAENLGIEKLNLGGSAITDEGWSIMCQSLATHPALKQHNLVSTASHDAGSRRRHTNGGLLMTEARKTQRTQCLVEMSKANTVVKHIRMNDEEDDETFWQNEIMPRLEMNELRSRIVAVKKTQGALRAP